MGRLFSIGLAQIAEFCAIWAKPIRAALRARRAVEAPPIAARHWPLDRFGSNHPFCDFKHVILICRASANMRKVRRVHMPARRAHPFARGQAQSQLHPGFRPVAAVAQKLQIARLVRPPAVQRHNVVDFVQVVDDAPAGRTPPGGLGRDPTLQVTVDTAWFKNAPVTRSRTEAFLCR